MPAFYVTFGQRSPFRDGFVVIEADDKETAREEAFEILGQKWAFIYSEDEFGENAREELRKESGIYYQEGQLGRTIRLPPGYRHH